MRALTVVAPRQAYVEEVAPPTPGPHEVVVEVATVGLCGTDAEVFSGQMAYLLDGSATYPIRLGHERAGTVTHVRSQVDASWPGRRVTGDTQLGCGQCSRCARGSAQTCPGRSELGLRGEYPGALAEEFVVPASCLCSLAYAVDDTGGALVEPGSNALRAVWGCDPSPGQDILVLGAGTIGLPAARFAAAAGANVQVVDSSARAVARARSNGSLSVARLEDLGAAEFSAVIDATSSPTSPELALNRVEPGGKVVYIGLSEEPSRIGTRALTLNDVAAIGILSGSPAMCATAEHYASNHVDPRPLVGATIGLEEAAAYLTGDCPYYADAGPKVLVDPNR